MFFWDEKNPQFRLNIRGGEEREGWIVRECIAREHNGRGRNIWIVMNGGVPTGVRCTGI
jgi:hypothetical protein